VDIGGQVLVIAEIDPSPERWARLGSIVPARDASLATASSSRPLSTRALLRHYLFGRLGADALGVRGAEGLSETDAGVSDPLTAED
jgi:hypothetical protein